MKEEPGGLEEEGGDQSKAERTRRQKAVLLYSVWFEAFCASSVIFFVKSLDSSLSVSSIS